MKLKREIYFNKKAKPIKLTLALLQAFQLYLGFCVSDVQPSPASCLSFCASVLSASCSLSLIHTWHDMIQSAEHVHDLIKATNESECLFLYYFLVVYR